VLEKRGPFGWRDLLPLMIDVCEALQYAHERRIIHRDIKPSNIMLVENGTAVKVVDFGIAKSVSETAPKLTKTNMMMGSVPYMSPSDFIGGVNASPAGDIYALGCTMIELLTGQPPFVGETIFDTIAMHSTAPVPKLGGDIPKPLQQLIEWMLEKKAEDRAPSAVAVRDCMRAILDGTPVEIGRKTDARNASSAGDSKVKSAQILMLAGVLVVLIAGTALFTGQLSQNRHQHSAAASPYLTDNVEEQRWVQIINQTPSNAQAYLRLASVYAHATPRQMGAAAAVLDKALSMKLFPKERGSGLFVKAGNELGFGDYDMAIQDCESSMKLVDRGKGYYGQKKILLSAYTPALRYSDQIKLASDFLADGKDVRDKADEDKNFSYSAIYCYTIEALIHEDQLDEALRYAKLSQRHDEPGFSTRLLALVARNKMGDKPSPREFEAARDAGLEGASPARAGLIDITLGWARSSRPEGNDDGFSDVVKGANALLKAPPEAEPADEMRIIDTAVRYIDYYRRETRMYSGENYVFGKLQDELRERHLALRERILQLNKPLPIKL
jgi:hypothetical protein